MKSIFKERFARGSAAVLLACAGTAFSRHCQAADANYEFSYQAPGNIAGAPGAVVTFIATAMLSKAKDPVQGWSISGAVGAPAICRVVATSVLGTAAQGADFESSEVTSGSGNEGFVSGVVLSFGNARTLAPGEVPYQLIKVLVEANVPADGSLGSCQLKFIDGRKGSGAPVSNIVTVNGMSRAPIKPGLVVSIGNDCNANGQGDALDLAFHVSSDCNADSVPDECQNDQDGDGAIDACDQCPADVSKTSQGVCGCNAPDIDANSNGIVDCNVTQELGALLDKIIARTKKLRPQSPGKKLSAVQKGIRADLRRQLQNLTSFVKANTSGIKVVNKKVKTAGLSRRAVGQTKRAIRQATAENRRLALQALRGLRKQLAV